MARTEQVNKTNIIQKVYRELGRLPNSYVVCVNSKESRGSANVNIGGTKFELKIHVFDSDLDDWTHKPGVLFAEFEDSDGIIRWNSSFKNLKNEINRLIEKKQNN